MHATGKGAKEGSLHAKGAVTVREVRGRPASFKGGGGFGLRPRPQPSSPQGRPRVAVPRSLRESGGPRLGHPRAAGRPQGGASPERSELQGGACRGRGPCWARRGRLGRSLLRGGPESGGAPRSGRSSAAWTSPSPEAASARRLTAPPLFPRTVYSGAGRVGGGGGAS